MSVSSCMMMTAEELSALSCHLLHSWNCLSLTHTHTLSLSLFQPLLYTDFSEWSLPCVPPPHVVADHRIICGVGGECIHLPTPFLWAWCCPSKEKFRTLEHPHQWLPLPIRRRQHAATRFNLSLPLCVCVCVCILMYSVVHVCVCVCERERERRRSGWTDLTAWPRRHFVRQCACVFCVPGRGNREDHGRNDEDPAAFLPEEPNPSWRQEDNGVWWGHNWGLGVCFSSGACVVPLIMH